MDTVSQIELHPYAQQRELQQRHAELGILTQAWSPIGGITFYRGSDGEQRSTLSDPVLRGIGTDHGKSAAQVMLRWHLQQGRSAIPKSVRPERIAENVDVFDFALTDDELAAINAPDTGALVRRAGRPIPPVRGPGDMRPAVLRGAPVPRAEPLRRLRRRA